MAYKHGEFVRMHFTCEASADSVKLHIGPHQGSYHPWWSELRLEVYGQNSNASFEVSGDKANPGQAVPDSAHHMVSVTIPDDGRGSDLEISARPLPNASHPEICRGIMKAPMQSVLSKTLLMAAVCRSATSFAATTLAAGVPSVSLY